MRHMCELCKPRPKHYTRAPPVLRLALPWVASSSFIVRSMVQFDRSARLECLFKKMCAPKCHVAAALTCNSVALSITIPLGRV